MKESFDIYILNGALGRIGSTHEQKMLEAVRDHFASHPELTKGPSLPACTLQLIPYTADAKTPRDWILISYVNAAQATTEEDQVTIDVVEAIPDQKSSRGKAWQNLVITHAGVFAQPWRLRIPSQTFGAMVDYGRVSVLNLQNIVDKFIDEVRPPHAIFATKRKEAEADIDRFFQESYTFGNSNGAVMALDHAVFTLHELIFTLGESFRFVPPISLAE